MRNLEPQVEITNLMNKCEDLESGESRESKKTRTGTVSGIERVGIGGRT
jgi:hypothetical protein